MVELIRTSAGEFWYNDEAEGAKRYADGVGQGGIQVLFLL